MRKVTRKFRNLLTGEVIRGYQTTDHACSSYGQPVWVNVKSGEAFDLMGLEPMDRHTADCPCPACKSKHGAVKVRTSFTLDPGVLAALERRHRKTRVPKAQIVEAALRKYLS